MLEAGCARGRWGRIMATALKGYQWWLSELTFYKRYCRVRMSGRRSLGVEASEALLHRMESTLWQFRKYD